MNKQKIFGTILISLFTLLFELTRTDEVLCHYRNIQVQSFVLGYGCEIKYTITNSEDSITIKGEHKTGKNDNDVRVLYYSSDFSYNLTKQDSTFCRKFPNLEILFLSGIVFHKTEPDALRECRNLHTTGYGESDINLVLLREILRRINIDFLGKSSLQVEHNEIGDGQNVHEMCGRPKIRETESIHGERNVAFPWVAAIKEKHGRYMCGGVLISNRKIVTAAHCIQNKDEVSAKHAKDLSVILDLSKLNDSGEAGGTIVDVERVNMHPSWHTETIPFDADIAILYLAQNVTFNDDIQPICILQAHTLAAFLRNAMIIRYNQNHQGSIENILKVIDMPLHDNRNCFNKSPSLRKISSQRTLCAGIGKGDGICRGDSGGGLYVEYRGVYYLRGIVSSSLIGRNNNCDRDSYSIFTDMLKFNEWINKN